MELTSLILEKYAGGQMEIQDQTEEYLYRGELKSISIKDDGIHVEFVWVAEGKGFPPFPHRWVNINTLKYVAGLYVYMPSNIGDGRIALQSQISNELVVLYPPDGSKLDIAKIEGLEI